MGNMNRKSAMENDGNHQTSNINAEDDSGIQSSTDSTDACSQPTKLIKMKYQINEQELKARLTPIQYAVTQEKATERPFTGEYNDHDEDGNYHCIVCEQELFTSDTKFPTTCGWPGFRRPVSQQNVDLIDDFSHDMVRTEVTCSGCNAHLGHVFDDGPLPDRTRYCINSAALKFIRKMPK